MKKVRGTGYLVALDKSTAKVAQIRRNAEIQGFNNIHTFVQDATQVSPCLDQALLTRS